LISYKWPCFWTSSAFLCNQQSSRQSVSSETAYQNRSDSLQWIDAIIPT